MSADTISPVGDDPAPHPGGSGGAGRGGSHTSSAAPLVVVQQGRSASPPRPAPRPAQTPTDTTLRNGYAAISHSVSGETAAIGIGFLVAGPVGAIVGGTALPVLVAASMWRARRREHDENTNQAGDRSGLGRDRAGRDRTGSGGGGGRRHQADGTGGGRHRTPNSPGSGNAGSGGGGTNRKQKTKDPVLDKLTKGLDKLRPNKSSGNLKDPKNKTPKTPKSDGGKPGNGSKDSDAKGLKDGLRDGTKGLLKDRGRQPDSQRPWRGRGDKDAKPKKDRKNKDSDGTTSSTARDGLDPKHPNDGGDGEVFDAEIVDDGLPPKPDRNPDDVIDGEVIDERIELVKKAREKKRRREALAAGRRAEEDAARDGTQGDPHAVRLEVIREQNTLIDLELQRQAQLIALAAATESRRSTPVNYPVATVQPGARTPGAAVARQVDARASTAYRILVAMAEQLANGLHSDDDADMADHVVELSGIPAMCRNLSAAVREGAAALQKTAPLHPSVIKHLNNAAVAALTASRMADTIIIVFVDAHREDIYRVMEPRIGEERWNIRNAAGTLDAAKLRAAILSSGQRQLALPAGASTGSGTGKVVPASDASTKRLIQLMKGFDRDHMVVCLSEVAGSARGVDVVADSITKLYRRMAKTWPTEDVVDDTVRATAAKVGSVAAELRKAIKAAQRAHQRELRLNAKPRKGAHAEKKWDVVKGRKG